MPALKSESLNINRDQACADAKKLKVKIQFQSKLAISASFNQPSDLQTTAVLIPPDQLEERDDFQGEGARL